MASFFASRILNSRRVIFTHDLKYIRNYPFQQIKPVTRFIWNKKYNIRANKSYSEHTQKTVLINSLSDARKKIIYPLSESNLINSKEKIIQKIREKQSKENIWTIPNYLTFSRLIASPIIGYFILNDQYDLALIAFIYAGFTDSLDGFIARKYNMKTMLGTVMDPAADKALMTIMTITLAMKDLLPIPIAAVILGRDIGLILASFYYRYISLPPPKTIGRYFDISIPSAEVRPTLISKVNTALQLALMGITLASPVFGWTHVKTLTVLQYTVAGTTMWSGLSYVLSKDAVRILKPPVAR
ncbi:CDP-diacylglycerol-glycerol-3-phosphate 3-phosphatidyltransferase [Rhizophagus clarus]|uniref:CDP-diacylglycerol-glycerol-3-phosphate 3-phosphatidyltransferase n=1 Tax=Rhizophagus clarus TaxID=94130 RepID=A0A8H3R544_9GLOM|nr:CDP-diacylglycerol-glycerol-3-phosphate 3-phosphatidyltransferase [Rhizophagus clarus]